MEEDKERERERGREGEEGGSRGGGGREGRGGRWGHLHNSDQNLHEDKVFKFLSDLVRHRARDQVQSRFTKCCLLKKN